MTEPLKQVERVAAYGVVRDSSARVLLVQASEQSNVPGTWFLPGGGVEHGEHPEATVVREFEEETGIRVQIDHLLCVDSDVSNLDQTGEILHHVRLVYAVCLIDGSLRDEVNGSSDLARWLSASQFEQLRLARFVARVLDVAAPPPA